MLSFTESWLKPNISTDSLKLPGYKPPYRRDRVDRITELSESKVGSTDFLPATLSLISQGSLALKLNNEQNVINGNL
jgi:hypothetical protein